MHQSAVKAGPVPRLELVPKVQAPARTKADESCLVCGAEPGRILSGLLDTRFGTAGTYDICRCNRCGFEQTSPVPTLEILKKLYESHYNFGGATGALYTKLRDWFLMSPLYRVWIRVDGDISFHSRRGSGRLMDVGCNEGRGLPIYARNGYKVEGLEPNDTAAGAARNLGFEVHSCLLEEFQPAAPYDVAILSNVLEHSLDPREMLEEINRILHTGGEVWISCPNSKSWLRRVFGRFWINWHLPFHISHFSTETLQRLLVETGFRAIETGQITPAIWVAQSCIARLFARKGRKNMQLRNPFLTLLLMGVARLILFPLLWLGNRSGQGDCLLVVARKG